jgi:hypothetical protein
VIFATELENGEKRSENCKKFKIINANCSEKSKEKSQNIQHIQKTWVWVSKILKEFLNQRDQKAETDKALYTNGLSIKD